MRAKPLAELEDHHQLKSGALAYPDEARSKGSTAGFTASIQS